MRTYNYEGSFELEDDFEIELNEGEVVVAEDGKTYEGRYALFLEVEYNYSVLTGISYANRVSSEDYEEDCEVTDIILLEGFTWNGKTYEEGKSIYEYPELLDLINEDWIEDKAFEKAQEECGDEEW
jgi:hypothetical protein